MSASTKRRTPTAAEEEVARIYLRNSGIISLLSLISLAGFVYFSNVYIAGAGVLAVATVAIYLWGRTEGVITMSLADKSVLVTGCDTGFGHVLAKQLLGMGVTVFAGCLNSSGDGATSLRNLKNSRMHVVQLDVTKDAQIHDVLDTVRKTTGQTGLWGVVNNAGLNFIGDVELTSMDQFERVTNINQLGTVRVTKAFLPLIRASKGRVVNVTSCKGRLSVIYDSAYDMTKFAGEAFSDILRMEMNKFGVKVVIIEPCNFGGATASLELDRLRRDCETMWAGMTPELRETYGRDYVFDIVKRAEEAIPTACTEVKLVTNKMVEALFSEDPKTRYLVGGSNRWYDEYKVRLWMYQWLPAWYMDSVFYKDIESYPLPKSLLTDS